MAERASVVSGGIPADWIYAQWAHETGGFTSRLSKEDHNYGGITTTTNAGGMEQPESPNSGVYYKHFDSDEEFADYFGNYLKLYRENGVFEAQSIDEYAAALKNGGYFAADLNEYINGMKRFSTEGGSGYSPLVTATNAMHTDASGATLTNEDLSPIQREPSFTDKLLDPITNGWLGRPLRAFWMQTTTGFNYDSNSYEFTKEDVDKVNKLFPNDKASQEFIYAHANSPEQLEKVIQMQLESKEMEKRIMDSSYGFSTIGTVLGTAITEALNPLNYMGAGIFTKGNILMRLAKSAAFTATLNTADAAIREKLTGRQQELVDAAVMGAAMGALIPAFSHLVTKGANTEIREAAEDMLQKANIRKAEAEAMLEGKELPKPKPNIAWDKIKSLHDKTYKTQHEGLSNTIKKGKATVVSRSNIGVMRNILGQYIDKNTKAFHYNGNTVFVKEVLDKMTPEEITGLLRHEIGVHSLSDDAVNSLLGYVSKKVEKPKGLWKQALDKATASTPKGQKVDLEEVLGYWAELRGDGKGGYLTDIKNIIRKATGDNSITDEDVLDIIRNNMKSVSDIEGGATRGDSLHFAVDADVSPNKIERLANAKSPDVQNYDRAFMNNKASKWLGKKFEDSWFYGTPFGTMVNSKIAAVRDLGSKLFSDARMRKEFANGMSAEDTLNYIMNKIAVPRAKFDEAFEKYAKSKYGFVNAHKVKNLMELNENVILMHDHLYANHALPQKIVQMSEKDQKELQNLAKLYNNTEAVAPYFAKELGYIEDAEYWRFMDKGTRRVVDVNKWRDWFISYKGEQGEQQAYKDLESWCYEACKIKWSENKSFLQARFNDEYAKATAKYKKDLKAGKSPQKPEKRIATDDEVEKFIKEEAHRAAYGFADQNTSNLTNGATDSMYWMHPRVHMDTSYTKVMNGKDFSFDKDLRSFDLQHTLDNTTRRWAGEIAVNTVIPDKLTYEKLLGGTKEVQGTLENLKAVIDSEGRQLKEAGGMTQAEYDKTIKVVNDSLDALRGISTRDRSWLDFSSDILRRFSYGRVGGNMGLNQRMDFGNMMGYVGYRGIASIMPNISIPFTNIRLKSSDALRNYFIKQEGLNPADVDAHIMRLMGDDLRRLSPVKIQLMNSKLGKDMYGSSLLDSVNNASQAFAAAGSYINDLNGLTARMLRDSQVFTYIDLLKATDSFQLIANGKGYTMRDSFVYGTRLPFSEEKLAQAGISDKKAYFSSLKKYMKDGHLDFDSMYKKNKQLYYQTYKLIDNQAKRCIVEPSIGNSNLLANANWFSRVLFQFKNFSFFANNSQFMRKMTHMEADDAMSTMYEMLTSSAITAGTIASIAYAKYPNSPAERDKYLKRRFDDFKWAAVSRSSTLGSPLSIAADALDTFGIKKNYRTTSGSSRYEHKVSDPNQAFWKAVSQTPTLDTFSSLWDNGKGYLDRGITEKNLRNTASILIPANQNWKILLATNAALEAYSQIKPLPKK